MCMLLTLITLLCPTLSLATPSATHLGCAEVEVSVRPIQGPFFSDESISVQASIQWFNAGCDVVLEAELRSGSFGGAGDTVVLSGSETEATLELSINQAYWGKEPTLTVWVRSVEGGAHHTVHRQHIPVINVCESKAVSGTLSHPYASIPGFITDFELYTIEELESAHRRSLDPAQFNEATADLDHLLSSYAGVMQDMMYRFNQVDVYQGYSLSCVHQCYGVACGLNAPRLVMSFTPIADLDQRFETLPLTADQLTELSNLKAHAIFERERLQAYSTITNTYESLNPFNHGYASHKWWVLKSIQDFHWYIWYHLEVLQADNLSLLRKATLKLWAQIFASEVHRMLDSDLCDADVLDSLRRPLDIIMNRGLELIDLNALRRAYQAGYERYELCLNRAYQTLDPSLCGDPGC